MFGLEPPIDDWVKEEAVEPEMFVERLQALADAQMEEKVAEIPQESWIQVEKSILLQSLDHHWKEHLAMLDALRQVVHLRAYAQKKPIDEYKHEAFALFERMLDRDPRGRDPDAGAGRASRWSRAGRCRRCPTSSPTISTRSPATTTRPTSTPAPAAILSRLPPLQTPQPECRPAPTCAELAAGQPQRALPVRLGPQVQALPRAAGVRGRRSSVILPGEGRDHEHRLGQLPALFMVPAFAGMTSRRPCSPSGVTPS